MKGFKAKLNFIHKTIKTIQCLDWCETLTINFNTINIYFRCNGLFFAKTTEYLSV